MLNAAALSTAETFIILLSRWLQFSEVLNFSCVCNFHTGPQDPILYDSFPKPLNFPSQSNEFFSYS